MNPPRGIMGTGAFSQRLLLDPAYLEPATSLRLDLPARTALPLGREPSSFNLDFPFQHPVPQMNLFSPSLLENALRDSGTRQRDFVQAFFMSIRSADFEITRIPSNERLAGNRASEFRLDGSGSIGLRDVGWEELTHGNLNLRIRNDERLNESILTHFIIAYDNELDASRRAFGIPIGVQGFTFQPQNQAMTGETDPIHPPVSALEDSVRIPNADQLNYSLRYSFNRLAAGFAQNLSSSFITGFWHSLGIDTNLYRHWNIPDNTFPANIRRIAPFVAQLFFTPEGKEYRRTHAETWGPNIPLFTFSNLQDLNWSMLLRPNQIPLPSGGNLEFLDPEATRAFLDTQIACTTNANERESLTRLRTSYNSDLQVNRFELRSHYERNRGGSLNIDLRNVALSLNIPLNSNRPHGSELLNIGRLLASRIHFEGPSITGMILHPSQQQNNLRLVIENAVLENLTLQSESLNLQLPNLHAERIEITLPSLEQLLEILNRHRRESLRDATATDIEENWDTIVRSYRNPSENQGLDFGALLQYWDEVLALSQVQMQNVQAASDQPLILDQRLSGIHFEARSASARSLNFSGENISHFSLREASLAEFTLEINGLGRIHSHENTLSNLDISLPAGQVLIQSDHLHSQGHLHFERVSDSPASQNTVLHFQGGTHLRNLRALLSFSAFSAEHSRLRDSFASENLRALEASFQLEGRLGAGSVFIPQNGLNIPLSQGLLHSRVELNLQYNPQAQLSNYHAALLGNGEAQVENVTWRVNSPALNASILIPQLRVRTPPHQNVCFRLSPQLLTVSAQATVSENTRDSCHLDTEEINTASTEPLLIAEGNIRNGIFNLLPQNGVLRSVSLQGIEASLLASLVAFRRREVSANRFELEVAGRDIRFQNIHLNGSATINSQTAALEITPAVLPSSLLFLESFRSFLGAGPPRHYFYGIGGRLQGINPSPHARFYFPFIHSVGNSARAVEYSSSFVDVIWGALRLYAPGHGEIPVF